MGLSVDLISPCNPYILSRRKLKELSVLVKEENVIIQFKRLAVSKGSKNSWIWPPRLGDKFPAITSWDKSEKLIYWRLILHLQNTRGDPNSSNTISMGLCLLTGDWKERQASNPDKSRSFLTYRKGSVFTHKRFNWHPRCWVRRGFGYRVTEEWGALFKRLSSNVRLKGMSRLLLQWLSGLWTHTWLLHSLCHLPGTWRQLRTHSKERLKRASPPMHVPAQVLI